MNLNIINHVLINIQYHVSSDPFSHLNCNNLGFFDKINNFNTNLTT